jgi:uncharacterized protein involved in outer membrane biogenesis
MKIFLSTLTGLIVVALLAAGILSFIFWARLPDIAATHLSKKLGVPVQIDSFGLGWSRLEAKKIEVGNPPGSILPKAFACEEIDVLAPLTRYLNRRIVIDEIDLQNVYLGLEFDSASGTSGNWTRIMGNLQTTRETGVKGGKKKKKQTEAQVPDASARSVLIHRIVLTNIDVDVVYKKEGGKIKRLPRIPRMELTEISSEGGLPMDQILNSVLGETLKQVFMKQNLKNMMLEFMNTPSPVQQYLAPFKGFFNAVPQKTDAHLT